MNTGTLKVTNKTRILFATHTRPDYMPPPAYSENMLVCSPYYPDKQDEKGNILSIHLPEKQHYDLAALINSLPAEQQPELVIARLDSTFQHIPGNICTITQPTIGLIGDTHHMRRPLQTMLSYLLHEHFDHLLIDHTPQHAHWFCEAGLAPIFWLPGTLLADQWIKPSKNPEKHVIFIGQMGKAHPVRNQMLEGIRDAGIPLSVTTAPQAIGCQHYNQAAITFNHSLNGDFNLRVFETLASGGFLLTEKLEPQAGLETLFKDGEHLVCYNGKQDLIEKCQYYLEHTTERNRIAAAGYQRVRELFSIQKRQGGFTRLLAGKSPPGWLPENIDARVLAYGCKNRRDLLQRMAIYEWLQEQHRASSKIRLVVSSQADARIVCDLVDLPRLSLSIKDNPQALKLAGQCEISTHRLQSGASAGDGVQIQLVAADDFNTATVLPRTEAVIISDWVNLDTSRKQEIARLCNEKKLLATNHTEGLFQNDREWSDVWNRPPHS